MPQGLVPRSSAHTNIQQIRAQTAVPAGPGGTLHDYVPFYFGERSPMLYANHKRGVQGSEGQDEIIYLVSTTQAVAEAAEVDWVFTDGHAIMAFTAFFDSLDALSQIDWKAVHAVQWKTSDDPDLTRRKQAEFLVHKFFPVSLLNEIAVMNTKIEQAVQRILADASCAVPTKVRRAWYY